jgi:hypothetical protein
MFGVYMIGVTSFVATKFGATPYSLKLALDPLQACH